MSSPATLRSGVTNSDFLQSLQPSAVPALIRIDWPADGLTLLCDQLCIRGRLALRPTVLAAGQDGPPNIELLLEPMEPLGSFAAGLRLVAERFPLSTTTPGVLSFEIDAIDSSVFGEGEFREEEEVVGYEFSVTLDCSALFPPKGAEPRVVWFSLATRVGDYLAVSNSLPASLLAREQRERAIGGFFSPQQSTLYSDFLDVSGWALRLGDRLEEVQVEINGVPQSEVQIDIPSRDVSKLFPGVVEAEQSRFLLCLKRDAVLQSGLSAAALNSQFVVTAKCRFASGEQLSLRSPALIWRPSPDCFGSSEFSAIESVRTTGTQGGVAVEGWIVSAQPKVPRLFLQGLQSQVEFGVHPSTTLEWIEREDVEQMMPTVLQHRPWGFRVTMQPSELGRCLGVPRFMTQLDEKAALSPVGSQSAWQQIAEAIAHFQPRGGALARLADPLARYATKLGVRRSIPLGQAVSDEVTPRSAGPKRILLVSHNLSGTEGAPKVLFEIAKAIKSVFQPQAELMVVSGREGSLRRAYEEIGVRVEVVPKLAVSAPHWGDFRQCFSRGFSLAAAFSPDLVYANCSGCFWGVQIAKRLEVPSLWCVHESVPPEQWCADLDTRYRMAFLDAISKTDKMLFVADSTNQLYAHAVAPERTRTIPNGVDRKSFAERRNALDRASIRRELGVAPEEKMISIIGTTTERKGQDIFLREMAKLRELMPQQGFRFFIVGARRSDFLDRIRGMAADLGLNDCLTFVAEQPDVENYFVASDIITMCSLEESAPLVSLEAFAYGVPLISTEVFGLAEQLEHKRNALCFSPLQAGELATCARQLLEDTDLAQSLVEGGAKSLVERFSIEQSTKLHWQEMCQVFARHRATRW